MWNLLKNKTIIPSIKRKQTTNEIIAEIHDTFYTEVDRLLAEANVSRSLDTDKQSLIDKCERLKALGFSNSKEVKEAEQEIIRLADLKYENIKKQHLIDAIEYFQFKYPNYKFITEDSVKKICEKYGLIYGTINKYIGTVPDKNLKHIEDFKISEEDECYESRIIFNHMGGRVHKSYVSHNAFILFQNEEKIKREREREGHPTNFNTIQRISKCLLEIAAPVKDFNMQDHEIKDFKISKIEVPDPIVLKPVFYKGEKHFLIVTMWGPESSDALLVNEKNN